MPIPVDESANVDGEGGTADGGLCVVEVAGTPEYVRQSHIVRVWLEPPSFQSRWSLRRAWTAFLIRMAMARAVVRTEILASFPSMAELTNHADDNGTDDA